MNDSLSDLWIKHGSLIHKLKTLDCNDHKFPNILIQTVLQLRKINLFIVERLRVQWDKEDSFFHSNWKQKLFELARCLHWMTTKTRRKYVDVIQMNVKLNPFLCSTRVNGKTAAILNKNQHLPSSLHRNHVPIALQMNEELEELCRKLSLFLHHVYTSHLSDSKQIFLPTNVATINDRPGEDTPPKTNFEDKQMIINCLGLWKQKLMRLQRYRCLIWNSRRNTAREVSNLTCTSPNLKENCVGAMELAAVCLEKS